MSYRTILPWIKASARSSPALVTPSARGSMRKSSWWISCVSSKRLVALSKGRMATVRMCSGKLPERNP